MFLIPLVYLTPITTAALRWFVCLLFGQVKAKLVEEQRRMDAFEQRKRDKDARKFAKEVQAERQKQRTQERKATEEAVTKWRKSRRGKTGIAGTEDDDKALEAMLAKPGKQLAAAGKPAPKLNRKRQRKDEKFGFGGQKRQRKANDASSAADMSKFSGGRNKQVPPTMGTRAKKGADRPGKSKRTAMRAKKG